MSSTPSNVRRARPAKGAERRIVASKSSTFHVSIATIATICCASTSRGLRGYRLDSTRPACIASVTAAHATRSPRNFGKITPLLDAFTWCRARPIRCRPLATDGGASICTTRSIAPMSIPSSSDEVATSAGKVAAFSASSTSCRCSRAIEPWCDRTSVSPASSLSAAASRSASRRLFTNSSVERWARISSSRRGWMLLQMDDRTAPGDAGLPGTAAGSASAPCRRPALRSSAPAIWAVSRRRR